MQVSKRGLSKFHFTLTYPFPFRHRFAAFYTPPPHLRRPTQLLQFRNDNIPLHPPHRHVRHPNVLVPHHHMLHPLVHHHLHPLTALDVLGQRPFQFSPHRRVPCAVHASARPQNVLCALVAPRRVDLPLRVLLFVRERRRG